VSEEEKKAIETLEIEGTENNYLEVKILLNLVGKQQKEIEDMREELQMYVDIGNNDLHNYISKDKIREIRDYITSLEYFNNNNKGNVNDYFVSHNKILKMIDELLEEN